jgi:hypothetical protein
MLEFKDEKLVVDAFESSVGSRLDSRADKGESILAQDQDPTAG